MKVSEKISLIESIALHFQEKYTYSKIDQIFSFFDLPDNGEYQGNNSKRLYTEHRLRGVSERVLLQIAEDFDIKSRFREVKPPVGWEDAGAVRVFISHIGSDRRNANRLKSELEKYNINAFVAHEDIEPTAIWAEEIKSALMTMDLFISMHTDGFQNRFWCQQEVGFAVARQIKIIPIKFSENPTGFISVYQALSRGKKNAERIVLEILNVLENDADTGDLHKRIIQNSDLIDVPF